MAESVYQFVFYPYVDAMGEDVIAPTMKGVAFNTSEAIQCIDREGRPYLQGFVILTKPMTPSQLRKATHAPSLMVIRVHPGVDITDHSTRLTYYESVCMNRGGVIYEPNQRLRTGDRDVFKYTFDHTNPPPYTPKLLDIRYEK